MPSGPTSLGVELEHDDVAAVHVVEVVAELVDQHPVALLQGGLHRGRRDVEGLEQERLHDQRHDQGADDHRHPLDGRTGAGPVRRRLGLAASLGERRLASARRRRRRLAASLVGSVRSLGSAGSLGVGHGPVNGSGRGCGRWRAARRPASDGGRVDHRRLRPEADEQPLEPRLGGHGQAHAQRAVRLASSTASTGYASATHAAAGVEVEHRPGDRRRRAGRRRPAAAAAGGSNRSSRSVAAAMRSTRKRRSAAGQVAVPEHVEAAVLGVDEVGVDVALGARVATVGVVVEVDARGARRPRCGARRAPRRRRARGRRRAPGRRRRRGPRPAWRHPAPSAPSSSRAGQREHATRPR